jgi:hypothetical protein
MCDEKGCNEKNKATANWFFFNSKKTQLAIFSAVEKW